MTLVSIQLNSNRPDQILRFFDSVEQTADHPEAIEVLLHTDAGDAAMLELTEREKTRRRFRLKTLQTDLVKGYSTLWMPLNPLFKLTDPEAYFVINLSDEMLFLTRGWDSMLKPYVGYYPDHLFRLRGSQYRFRNYTDLWDCGFAPDSLAFYTKRWLDLQGEWNPCLGPDSFQQCVAFYLYTSDPHSHRQYNRDIPLPFMQFSGEGASIGLEGDALYRRMCINNRAWFTLMSQRMQQEAKRRAMLMKAHIIAHAHPGSAIEHQPQRRRYLVRAESGVVIERIGYRRSWLSTTGKSWLRAPLVYYFAGGGRRNLVNSPLSSAAVMLATFTPLGPGLLGRAFGIRNGYRHIRGVMRRHGIFIGCVTAAEVAASLLLPQRVKDRFRASYLHWRRRLGDRPVFDPVLLEREAALAPRGFIHHRCNHVCGTIAQYGLAKGMLRLSLRAVIVCTPGPLRRTVGRPILHAYRARSGRRS
jgi:hypothetical protein